MVITMAKLRMAHASTHGARKPPGPKNLHRYVIGMISYAKKICRTLSCFFLSELGKPGSQSNNRVETGRDGFLRFLG